MRMFFQRGTTKHDKVTFPLIDLLSPSTQEYVGLALIIGIGYFLSSAVSLISSDFFDDDEILLGMPESYLHPKGRLHTRAGWDFPTGDLRRWGH
jgi:hypothetical protein